MRRTPSETTAAMMRPELMEIKTHIKSLKKEAEMRLTLDVEAQQSFEFLSDQVQGLRKAFSTLSDVLIEEVDLIRSEAATRHEEVAEKLSAQAKGLKAARTDLTLLRSEGSSTGYLNVRINSSKSKPYAAQTRRGGQGGAPGQLRDGGGGGAELCADARGAGGSSSGCGSAASATADDGGGGGAAGGGRGADAAAV